MRTASSSVSAPAATRRLNRIPRQLASLIQTNVNVQGLTVEAALTGRREAVYQAAMLDPHTAAELSMDEIAALVDDLLEAHGEWIPPLRVYRQEAETSHR